MACSCARDFIFLFPSLGLAFPHVYTYLSLYINKEYNSCDNFISTIIHWLVKWTASRPNPYKLNSEHCPNWQLCMTCSNEFKPALCGIIACRLVTAVAIPCYAYEKVLYRCPPWNKCHMKTLLDKITWDVRHSLHALQLTSWSRRPENGTADVWCCEQLMLSCLVHLPHSMATIGILTAVTCGGLRCRSIRCLGQGM
jgi:hypothetical protein